MIRLLLICFILLPSCLLSQSVEDKKIIITAKDTSNIYLQVKYALVNNDFIVKDNGILDSLTTYPFEMKNLLGLARITAIIKGNTITLSGIYGLKQVDDFGYNRITDYKSIMYCKGCKAWRLLMHIAETIGYNQIEYKK